MEGGATWAAAGDGAAAAGAAAKPVPSLEGGAVMSGAVRILDAECQWF
jgi:hypothetical protein